MNLSREEWQQATRTIIKLVHSERLPDSLPHVTHLLHVAKANDLLYGVGIQLAAKRPFPEPYETKFAIAMQRAQETKRFIDMIFPAMAQAKLPVFVIKTFLPFHYIDSNVDVVLAQPEKTAALIKLLDALGFERQYSLADLREPTKKMYRPINATHSFPRFHLHTAISWNGVEAHHLPGVWERCQTIHIDGQSLKVPSAEDEIIIMAAHALLENKYISLHELIYLHTLMKQQPDWQAIAQVTQRYGWHWGYQKWGSVVSALANALGLASPPFAPAPLPDNWQLPLMLGPQLTFGANWRRLAHDVQTGKWTAVPRQLFSYTFVDAVWMYRKARRKCHRGRA